MHYAFVSTSSALNELLREDVGFAEVTVGRALCFNGLSVVETAVRSSISDKNSLFLNVLCQGLTPFPRTGVTRQSSPGKMISTVALLLINLLFQSFSTLKKGNFLGLGGLRFANFRCL